MRRLTAATAVIAIVALAGSAGAFTLAEWERYGYAMSTYDARSLGMGGAGLAAIDGAAGMALNPALLGKTEGIDVALTGLIVLAEESRETPLHDSFEGVIGYNTYALSTEIYDRYVGAVAFNTATELTDFALAPVVAIGYGPRIDMSYGYHVQYRDPDFQTEPADKVISDYYLEGDGGVNAFSMGLGQELTSDVYVGLGVDFLRGDYRFSEREVFPADSEEEDTGSYDDYDDVKGTRFTLGVLFENLDRVDVAAVYRSPFTLSGDRNSRTADSEDSTTNSFKYGYPGELALGLEYHPQNMLMTTVSCDIEYTHWSGFEDDTMSDDPGLDDTFTYRLGVEHGFFDDTFARFGFSYRPSYVDKRNTTTAFSVGLGIDVLGVRLDLGGQVGLRDYGIGDDTEHGIEKVRVRETTTLAMMTVTHTF